MDILQSDWLIHMLKKAGKTPHARMLSLFDIVDDWLYAPKIDAPNISAVKSDDLSKKKNPLLHDFLTQEATKAGAAMPEMLASQLYFMLLAAMQEKLHANNPNSLSQAKIAANALISAQTKKEFHIAKPTAYAFAASFAGVCAITGGLLMVNMQKTPNSQVAKQVPIQTVIPQMVAAEAIADPNQTAALMAQIEQMRHGNCQLIEALQLPDNQKGIYLNMVVNGQVSTDPQEQAIAFELLRRTRCNYAPMLMANSKG